MKAGSAGSTTTWVTDTPTLLRDIIDVDEYALANADCDAMRPARHASQQRSVLLKQAPREHYSHLSPKSWASDMRQFGSAPQARCCRG
jgi:hypothetical protein